jgi:hypothetical protein
MWGYAIIKKAKKHFLAISKDGKCDSWTEEDLLYLKSLLGDKYSVMCEGVYRVSAEADVEKILLENGFHQNEYRAGVVLSYMKEQGSLR